VLFAINLALVLYLVITKRLFGIRGGKKSYDARLRGESVLEAARRAADSEPQPAAPDGGPPDSAEVRDSAAARGRSPDPAAHDPAATASAPSPDPTAAPGQSQTPAAAHGRSPHPEPDPASRPEPVKRRSLPDCGPRLDDLSRILYGHTRTNRSPARTRAVKSGSYRTDSARFAWYGTALSSAPCAPRQARARVSRFMWLTGRPCRPEACRKSGLRRLSGGGVPCPPRKRAARGRAGPLGDRDQRR